MNTRIPWLLSSMLACGIAMHARAQVTITATTTPPKPAAPAQVDPNVDLAKLYPEARSIGLTIAIAPDPQVPRYRRLFDLEVQAITLGMLNDGYVLDRYAFASETDPQAFGLLIFRCDGWRGYPCQNDGTLAAKPDGDIAPTTRVRAVYLVSDTATWGAATKPLTCATVKIRDQISGIQRKADPSLNCAEAPVIPANAVDPPRTARVELLKFPGACSSTGNKTLVVMGPNF